MHRYAPRPILPLDRGIRARVLKRTREAADAQA
jgi:hypothetical protein